MPTFTSESAKSRRERDLEDMRRRFAKRRGPVPGTSPRLTFEQRAEALIESKRQEIRILQEQIRGIEAFIRGAQEVLDTVRAERASAVSGDAKVA